MGKLNVTILRYLTKEDFRVLTAVSRFQFFSPVFTCLHAWWCVWLTAYFVFVHRLKWVWKIMNWFRVFWLHRLLIWNLAVYTNFCVNYANTNLCHMSEEENVSKRHVIPFISFSFWEFWMWRTIKIIGISFENSWWLSPHKHWLWLFGAEITHPAWFRSFIWQSDWSW